jgi:ABC-type antimicrobial peptide transport system permease subunit
MRHGKQKSVVAEGAIIRCVGRLSCNAQLSQAIIHFVSRRAMDIEGLGERSIEQFVAQGLIRSPADLYALQVSDLLPLEGFAQVSAQKLVDAISASKHPTLPRFIYALVIPEVGDETAKLLASTFGDLAALREALPVGRFRILDWRQLNHNLFTSLGLQRLVLAVLFLFIVLVASFNIVCTLIMIVLEKNKDIAILKSMGASNWGVMKTFVLQGVTIGFIGTFNGLIGGLAVCLFIKHTDFGLDPSIYMIDHLPVRIIAHEFLFVGLVAMLISLVATIGPAYWAARLNPVDGLRYD